MSMTSLRARLIAMVAAVSIGALAVSIAAVGSKRVADALFEQTEVAIEFSHAHLSIVERKETLRGDVYALVTARSPTAIERLQARINRHAGELRESFDSLSSLGVSDRDVLAALEEEGDLIAEFTSISEQIADEVGENRLAAISRLGDFLAAYDRSKLNSEVVTGAIDRWSTEVRSDSGSAVRRASWAVVLIALASFAASSVMVGFLLLRIENSMKSLDSQVGAVARGDLTARGTVAYDDELSALSRMIEAMSESLRSLIVDASSTIRVGSQTATTVAEHAREVLDLSRDAGMLSEEVKLELDKVRTQFEPFEDSVQELLDASHQAASAQTQLDESSGSLRVAAGDMETTVEAAAKTTEQLAITAGQAGQSVSALAKIADETLGRTESVSEAACKMSETAKEAEALSQATHTTATESYERMQQTADGLTRIQTAQSEASESMGTLHARSNDIRSVLDLLDQISDETELLALNAAIVAAQAGEKGGSFGVVAREVRSLSDRAKSQTATVREIIDQLADDAERASEVVKRNGDLVTVELESALGSRDSLASISQSAGQSAEIASEITRLAEGQRELCELTKAAMAEVRVAAVEVEQATSTQQNETVRLRGRTDELRETGQRVLTASQEQSQAAERLAVVSGSIRDVSERINHALGTQKSAVTDLTEFAAKLLDAADRTRASAQELDRESGVLTEQTSSLEKSVNRFTI